MAEEDELKVKGGKKKLWAFYLSKLKHTEEFNQMLKGYKVGSYW